MQDHGTYGVVKLTSSFWGVQGATSDGLDNCLPSKGGITLSNVKDNYWRITTFSLLLQHQCSHIETSVNKMADIMQMTFSNAVSWKHVWYFDSNFTAVYSWGSNIQYISTGPGNGFLTHWGRDKMATIFQTTLSNAFSWMKMYEFRLRFHRSLFLRFQLTISQHWFW